VATQDAVRQKGLVVPDKAERVYNFHRLTLKALADMLAAAGLEHPGELGPDHLVRRISTTEIRHFSEIHTFLRPGELIGGTPRDGFYARTWRRARPESFG
jgi:hypothetical protein